MKIALVMFDNCYPAMLKGHGLRKYFDHATTLIRTLVEKHPGELSMIVMTEILEIEMKQWDALVALMKELGFPYFHYCHKDIPLEEQVGTYTKKLSMHMSNVVFSAFPPETVRFESAVINQWDVPTRGTRYNYAIVAHAGGSRLAITHTALSFGRDNPVRPGAPVLKEWAALREVCDAAVGDLNVLPHFLFWAHRHEDGAYADLLNWVIGPDFPFADFHSLPRDRPPLEDYREIYPNNPPHEAFTPAARFDDRGDGFAGVCGPLGTHTKGLSCVATYLPITGLPDAHRLSPADANARWIKECAKDEPQLGDHFFKVLEVKLPGFATLGK